jgi:protein SCO1/2
MVLRVDPAAGTMLVSHHDIPGFMPAMTMPFRVRDLAALGQLKPGTRIAFQLRVGRETSEAREIEVLRQDLGVPVQPPATALAPGSEVPDFALLDQLGQVTRLSDYRGKVVVIDFIYTRCPLPEVCPRLSANFARLQRGFSPADAMLLSITIDPRYDTPPVLARYATIWKAKPEGWKFLTGTIEQIREVAARFGMIYWPEEGSLTHTSQTAVIGRDGRLAALVEGARYPFPQLRDLVAMEVRGRP